MNGAQLLHRQFEKPKTVRERLEKSSGNAREEGVQTRFVNARVFMSRAKDHSQTRCND
jgi:PP-loop superfamily ATP-utilizing enzyme